MLFAMIILNEEREYFLLLVKIERKILKSHRWSIEMPYHRNGDTVTIRNYTFFMEKKTS